MAYKWGHKYKSDYELAVENLLHGRTASKCLDDAALLPTPRKLFDVFWHEGEMAVLVGDAMVGKSALGVQIADAISKGLPIQGFCTEAEKQKVLYFDFEKGDKAFESRYAGKGGNGYVFDDNFIRVVLRHEYNEPKNMGDVLFTAIENMIMAHGAKVVIVDSVTGIHNLCHRYPHSLHVFLLRLKRLQMKLNLSMLVVADTEKDNRGRRLTRKRIEDSHDIFTTASSVFAMGVCNYKPNVRYLLHLKCMATAVDYNECQTAVCRMVDERFNFICRCAEKHLTLAPLTCLEEAIALIHEAEPELTLGEIAHKTGTYKMKVKRTLDALSGLKELKAALDA